MQSKLSFIVSFLETRIHTDKDADSTNVIASPETLGRSNLNTVVAPAYRIPTYRREAGRQFIERF